MAIRTGTVLVKELAATPATPASGDLAVYGKTDGQLYYKNDSGTEHALVSTSETQTLSGKSFSDLIGASAGINTKLSAAKNATDAPDTYPNGLSTASVISTNGWPVTGVLVTVSQESARNYTMQLLMSQNQAASYKRHSSDGTTWSAWSRMVFEGDTQTLTGKTISGASNTFSAIPQSAVTNLTTDLAALPRGLLASWTLSSNSAASAAERVQFTFSFTAESSRSYRVVVSGGLVDSESSVAQSAYCNIRWQQGSAVATSSAAAGRMIIATPGNTNADLASGVHVEGLITTATAGTVNCGFFIQAANGTNTVRYFATSIPARVYVYDVGPSVTVGSLTIT